MHVRPAMTRIGRVGQQQPSERRLCCCVCMHCVCIRLLREQDALLVGPARSLSTVKDQARGSGGKTSHSPPSRLDARRQLPAPPTTNNTHGTFNAYDGSPRRSPSRSVISSKHTVRACVLTAMNRSHDGPKVRCLTVGGSPLLPCYAACLAAQRRSTSKVGPRPATMAPLRPCIHHRNAAVVARCVHLPRPGRDGRACGFARRAWVSCHTPPDCILGNCRGCRADNGRGDSNFMAGFLVGGAVFGALGFIFAPQASAAALAPACTTTQFPNHAAGVGA
jgi:hypothetical protein